MQKNNQVNRPVDLVYAVHGDATRKRKQSKRLEAPEKVPFSKVSSTKDAALPRMPVVTRLHVGTGMGYLSTTYIIQNAAHMQVSMYLAPHHRRCWRRTLAEAGGLLACTATSYVQLCVHQTSFLSTVVCFFAGFLFLEDRALSDDGPFSVRSMVQSSFLRISDLQNLGRIY